MGLRDRGEAQKTVEFFRQCIPMFQALGDEVRQDILIMLAETEGLNVNQIAERSPMSRPNISHHLKILRQAGLVKPEKKGTEVFYSLELNETVKQLKQLIGFIEEECFLEEEAKTE